MNLPDSIRDDAYELEGAPHAILYKLVLHDTTVIALSPKGEYWWQGDLYEEVPCHMPQSTRSATGEKNRPKFSFVNPEGIFTTEIHERKLEGARLTRHRIMKSDLEANRDSAMSETFRISRVVSVTNGTVVCECRAPKDSAGFKLPHRTFRPPEFPLVRL